MKPIFQLAEIDFACCEMPHFRLKSNLACTVIRASHPAYPGKLSGQHRPRSTKPLYELMKGESKKRTTNFF